MSEQARARRQAARMRAAVRARDARIQELEQRLIALETSTTLKVGRLVTGAARRPAKGAVRLPAQLYRLWRTRHAPQLSATQRESGRLQLDALDRPEDRLLAAAPYEGLVIAGVLGRTLQERLADRAKLLPLYPHDALTVLEAADADVLVVDGAAGEPGGPWAYLGTPGLYDRERVLNGLLEIARERGLPAVLWGGAPPPVLRRLSWEAVLAPGAGPDDLAAALSRLTALTTVTTLTIGSTGPTPKNGRERTCDHAPSSTATSTST